MSEFDAPGAGAEHFHVYLLLDGSGSMTDVEETSKAPKNRAIAKMVQELLNTLHDDASISRTELTVICWDSKNECEVRLAGYDVKLDKEYRESLAPEATDSMYDRWDPVSNHGSGTPTAEALQKVRKMAEFWVNSAFGISKHRAVIYLMSDGMTTTSEPDCLTEMTIIKKFNSDNESSKGRIRVATVGYFQLPAGGDANEDKGRQLLKTLPENPNAYFETKSATKIAAYIKRTLTSER